MMQPLSLPVQQALCRTTLRRMAVRFRDWADTARRAEDYWRSVENPLEAARSAGEAKAYANCANEAAKLAELIFPQEKSDEDR